MVSKAAERSSRQRQESFCEPIAVMRWFDYFGNKRKVRDWTVIRKLLIV